VLFDVSQIILTMSDFTFYADLVGISSLYATSPHQAYEKLNEYYNEVFIGLDAYYRGSASRKVEMYSDSLVVSGDDLDEFLLTLAPLYMKLLSKGLMPRGGIAAGRLNFDMRITTENFRKNLPDSDVLARCVALERKVKGARIVIESGLAKPYFGQCQEWVTLHGYVSDPKRGDRDLVVQRSIVPLPDGSAFEILYPVIAAEEEIHIETRKSELDYMIGALPKDISVHHYETKRLLEHSQRRLKDQKA
jgi:hypothetical protein